MGSTKAALVAADGLLAAASHDGGSYGASSSAGASGDQERGAGPAGRGGGALDSSLSAVRQAGGARGGTVPAGAERAPAGHQ